jgi:hypothetical protein
MDRPLRGRQAFHDYQRTFIAFPDLRIDVIDSTRFSWTAN